jgi:hypothetical protein
MVSSFLLSIAKDYNPHIQRVAFEDLTYLRGQPYGIAWEKTPGNLIIEIDPSRVICPYQALYVFYHELGHIMCGHVAYRRALGGASPYREAEADAFAFREMRLLDPCGHVKEETRLCYSCFCSKSKVCLKTTPRGV